MEFIIRQANSIDIIQIWELLQQGILRRKEESSNQWQDGYPNLEVVKKDIEKGAGYVIANMGNIMGYLAILINDEPEYAQINGKWLSNKDFVVFHRLVVSDNYLRKCLSVKLLEFVEEIAFKNNISSIKADTNFDNNVMLKIFERMNYTYCGEVNFRGSTRRAYEKLLDQSIISKKIK